MVFRQCGSNEDELILPEQNRSTFMKKTLLGLMVGMIMLSCEEEFSICDLPKNSIPSWMEILIDENAQSDLSGYFYFQTAEYEGQQVFIANNCCPNCSTVVSVYNCKGEVIGNLRGEINIEDLENLRLFWSPKNSQCRV
jgi:hypothetical protein